MTISDLTDLYAHMEWADQTVWDTALSFPAGSDDGAVLDAFLHLHATQKAFLCLWKGLPVTLPERSEFESASAIRAWASGYYSEARDFIGSRDDADLESVVEIPWAKHFTRRVGKTPEAVSLEQTAYQVVAHSQYHRGQINRRLRELGAVPPLVDYIAWLWFDRPESTPERSE